MRIIILFICLGNNFSKTSCVIWELSEILYFILKLVYKAFDIRVTWHTHLHVFFLGTTTYIPKLSSYNNITTLCLPFTCSLTLRSVNKNITKWRIHQKWHFKWLLGEIYTLINNGFSRIIVKMYSKKQIIIWLCKSAQCKWQCISYIHVYYYPEM